MSQLLGCVRALSRHRLVRNLFALYVVKVVNQLLPLAIIPFLARVLGSTEWGRVAMAQALATWSIIVIQYGFPLSGTRAIAQAADPAEESRILSGILGCQAALAAVFVLIAWGIYAGVPAFQQAPLIVNIGLSAGITMLLGTWLTPRHAAFFFAAEKLCYPLAWLLGPINTAMMPRLTRLIDSSPERARRMTGLALALMLAAGMLLALGVALASPWLVPLVFGPGYEPARPVILPARGSACISGRQARLEGTILLLWFGVVL